MREVPRARDEVLDLIARLPFAVCSAYAYSPDEGLGRHRPGAYHLYLLEPLSLGRLQRQPGDALCKPRRRFWGLDRRDDLEANLPSCRRCLEIAARLAAC